MLAHLIPPTLDTIGTLQTKRPWKLSTALQRDTKVKKKGRGRIAAAHGLK